MSTTTPIWFLDIDGVINVPPPYSYDTGKNKAKRLRVHPEWAKIEIEVDDEVFKIMYAPAVIDFINEIHRSGKAKVVFLTTWRKSAVEKFAPAVGLDETIDFVDCNEGVESNYTVHKWWKYKTVSSYLPCNFIWTDDDIRKQHFVHLVDYVRQHGFDGLAFHPAENKGLEVSHFNAINNFLASLPA